MNVQEVVNRKGSDDVTASPKKGNLEELKKQLRSKLAKGGDISDIDKIFEHVLGESRRVYESLNQANDGDAIINPKKSFLKFYETASRGEMDEYMKEFIGVDNSHHLMKSEAYYWTKHGRVKGILTIADTYIMYDPLYWEENSKYNQETLATKFQACIDIQDIMNVDIIKLPNETAMYVQDDESRQSYLYDYYLQFTLCVVNAKTLKKMLGSGNKKKKRRRKRAIATVFFRFSHRDKDGNYLKNKKQSSVVDFIQKDVIEKQKIIFAKYQEPAKKSSKEDVVKPAPGEYVDYHSNTFVPYYDKIPKPAEEVPLGEDEFELINEEDSLDKDSQGFSLREVNEGEKEIEISPVIEEIPDLMPKSEGLDRFIPTCSESSTIMSETQIMLIARMLPPLFRMREWRKLYSVAVDGVSLQTFYKKAKGYSNSVLFIEDANHFKFGWYTTEEWAIHKHFYGTIESFLFTFRNTEEDIEFYKWTGYNDHIQFSDKKSIAVGGADGKFALYLRNNLYDGVSHKCGTFGNEILASDDEFEWIKLELWGFDY